MNARKRSPVSEFQKRVKAEIEDNLDEDIELELEDDDLAGLLSETGHLETHGALPRQLYFTELLRLQRELIKLQDWVVAKKLKLVVIFEGRDSAGKGGAIKQVMQRLNPRVVRTVALPAPTERERGQWYFQRYVSHLPAGGEIVLFDRSWYNRAGVEKVMGFCTEEEYEDFFQSAPEFERLLVRSGIVLVKYWFSICDDEQHLRFLMRINDPLKQWKLSPMDLEFEAPLGDLHQGQGDHVRAHAHPRGAMVGDRGGRQEARAPQLHRPSLDPAALPRRAAREADPAAAGAQSRLPPQPRPQGHVRARPLRQHQGRAPGARAGPRRRSRRRLTSGGAARFCGARAIAGETEPREADRHHHPGRRLRRRPADRQVDAIAASSVSDKTVPERQSDIRPKG